MKIRKPKRQRGRYRGYLHMQQNNLEVLNISEIFLEPLGVDKLVLYICIGNFKIRDGGRETVLYKHYVERYWGTAEYMIENLLLSENKLAKQAALAYIATGQPVSIPAQSYDIAIDA